VAGGRQVLICPDCQRAEPSWSDTLDRCWGCGSTRLSLVLGSIVCRACGCDRPAPHR
jgi:predicted amidophosphoribosyltransferase